MAYESDIDELGGADRFSNLTVSEQKRFLNAVQQMTGYARQHAIPILFSPPPSVGGKINGGTGFVLKLNSGAFLVTAFHVLEGYEMRLQSSESVQWQVGNLLPFDPMARIAWKDAQKDIVLMHLLPEEVQRLSPHCLIATPATWPPIVPKPEQLILVAGYPKTLREVNTVERKISAGGYATMFSVTTIGEGYFMCQVEQKDLISYNGDPLPAPDSDIGGISGGPAFLVTKFHYPLVGIITESQQTFGCQLLRVSTLDSVYEKEFISLSL